MATFADDALVNSLFPADNVALSERWARSRYTDLRYYSTPAHGGHFAAYEAPGEFVAEVGQLSGQPAFVDVQAIDDVEALLISPENLRALMIEEPELGERIMRALILRRIALIEAGAGGPVLIGPEDSPDVIRLHGFLSRNAYPHHLRLP